MPDSISADSQLLGHESTATARRFEATRYLAAAAHSDSAFRESVLNLAERPPHLCRAPEFGIDERVVIDECRRADQRRKICNALLLAMLLVFLSISDFVPDFRSVLFESTATFDLLLKVHAGELVLLVLAGATVWFGETLLREHFTLRRRFTSPFWKQSGSAMPSTEAARQNLVVYGGYYPFAGSGWMLRNWSFSVNLQKTVGSGERRSASELSVKALTDFVRRNLDNLQIPELEHYHVLFADGRYVRNDRRLMPSTYSLPPRTVPDEILFEDTEELETRRRTYLCISVTDWSGEMVLTTYVRFKEGKSNLFVEASSFILPPLKQSYYDLDTMDPILKIRTVVGLAVRSVIAAPFCIAWSPISVGGIIMEALQRWSAARKTRRSIRDNPLFNYGALTSIRQIGMENRFRVYFQQLDRDMHMKTVEQCLIDAIIDCLEEHGIDTSDIRQRRAAILNNGVMISGGVVTVESMAAGSGAQSIVSERQSTIPQSKAS